MDDHYLSHHVEVAVLLFADGRKLAVRIGTAEAGIVQAIDHYRCLRPENGSVSAHLWYDGGDNVGIEDPPAGCDGLRDDTQGGGGVGEPVSVAGAEKQGRHVLQGGRGAGRKNGGIP